MGTNTLSDLIAGATAQITDTNNIHTALKGNFVPRRTDTGAPDSNKLYDLGTNTYQWRNIYGGALYIDGVLIDFDSIGSSQNNGIQSGRTRTTSRKSDFLRASGSGATATILGATTNLVYTANQTAGVVSTDLAITGMTLAPSSNNTCLVNDSFLNDQYFTKWMGENGGEIEIDNIGTEISNRVGQYCCFKKGNEYFMGYVESDRITNCLRGFFFDDSGDPIERETLANNDTLTIMSLGWVFLDQNGTTVDVSYKSPFYGFDEPASPATDDYWFDTEDLQWKRYNGSSFDGTDRLLIGWVVLDETNCVASRSVDFSKPYKDDINIDLLVASNTEVETARQSNYINIDSTILNFGFSAITWDITTDLESGQSESNSTYYYLYITEEGQPVMSETYPYDRRKDLKGFYHPYETWRYVGMVFNNSSGNLENVRPISAAKDGLIGVQYLTDTGSGVWVKMPGTNKIIVEVVSGGGGGAFRQSGLINGTSGGSSSFGSYITCAGGGGGTASGGAGNAVTGGDVIVRGRRGFIANDINDQFRAPGTPLGNGGQMSPTGMNASGYGGAGASLVNQSFPGDVGSGGSGGYAQSTIFNLPDFVETQVGTGGNGGSFSGDGSQGIIIVREYA